MEAGGLKGHAGLLVIALLGAPLLPGPATAALPPSDCTTVSPTSFDCVWDYAFLPTDGAMRHWAMPPNLTAVVVEMSIVTDSRLNYVWGFCVAPMRGAGDCPAAAAESPEPGLAESNLTRTALVMFDPSLPYHFMIHRIAEFPFGPALVPATFHAEGHFQVVTHDVPAGGRAGSPQDPQLRDRVDEVSTPTGDIAGGWIDQPFLDDGLVEFGLVIPHLRDLHPTGNEQTDYRFSFDALGDTFTIYWRAQQPPDAYSSGWRVRIASARSPTFEESIELTAVVDLDNGTISLLVPLRIFGEVRSDDLFTNFSASSSHSLGVLDFGDDEGAIPLGATQDDTATNTTRPFAVGGPKVWDRLRGLPESSNAQGEPVQAAWVAAPFAPTNLPLTLLLVGTDHGPRQRRFACPLQKLSNQSTIWTVGIPKPCRAKGDSVGFDGRRYISIVRRVNG